VWARRGRPEHAEKDLLGWHFAGSLVLGSRDAGKDIGGWRVHVS